MVRGCKTQSKYCSRIGGKDLRKEEKRMTTHYRPHYRDLSKDSGPYAGNLGRPRLGPPRIGRPNLVVCTKAMQELILG